LNFSGTPHQIINYRSTASNGHKEAMQDLLNVKAEKND